MFILTMAKFIIVNYGAIMSLDNLYTDKQREDQSILDSQADFEGEITFDRIRKAHRMGFITDLMYAELQVQTPEWGRMKNGS